MTNLHITRKHTLTFNEAVDLIATWQTLCETKYNLVGEYFHISENRHMIRFKRLGAHGHLIITDTEYQLDLTLGYLFSLYKHRIETIIHRSLDTQLRDMKSDTQKNHVDL